MADLEGEGLDAGRHRGAGVGELGVAVPGQHLGGRHRSQTQPLADVALHGGVDVGVRPDRPGQLPDADGVAGPPEAVTVAPHLEGPQRQLGPHRGRLGVDAVGAADHGDVAQPPGPVRDRLFELRRRVDEQRGGSGEREGEGGVDHVGGRQPVVDPPPGRLADPAGHDVDEGGHVVVGDALPGLDLGHVGGGDHAGGALLDGGDVGGGDGAEQRPRLHGEDLDLQHGGEAGLVAPQRGHLRQ